MSGEDEEEWKVMVGGRLTDKTPCLEDALKIAVKRVSELLPDRQVFIVIGDDGDWSIRTNLPISNHECATVFK